MPRDDLDGDNEVWVERGNVSALDRGLLYGDGVFETLRCYDGAPAFVDRHLDRLHGALEATGIDEEFTVERVEEAVDRTTSELEAGDSYLRVTVTRGERSGLLNPTETEATVFWTAKPLTERRYPPAEAETTEVKRPAGAAGRHKTLNYLQNVLARQRTDADEALMLDSRGEVASGSVSNVFTVRDDTVTTPEHEIRRGVTREVVLDVADDLGYETRTEGVDLGAADAVFLTNTTWGVRPVTSVDDGGFPGHEAVEELRTAYLERALEDAEAQ